jgi:hypothetical protein
VGTHAGLGLIDAIEVGDAQIPINESNDLREKTGSGRPEQDASGFAMLNVRPRTNLRTYVIELFIKNLA